MITQQEFEHLIKLKKKFKETETITLSASWAKDIVSVESREIFILNYHARGSFEIKRFTYNKRYRTSVVLIRFDSSGRHTNPPELGGDVFDGPHIHIYKEGYGDKFATPITTIGLSNSDTDKEVILRKFLEHCNISIPVIQNDLF